MDEGTVVERCNYKTYFEYKTRNNEKVGVCLLCQKENVTKELKMKNSNTTGLKKHLEKNHEEAYKHLFGSKAIKHKILPEKHKTMDLFLNVSEIKFYKLCMKHYYYFYVISECVMCKKYKTCTCKGILFTLYFVWIDRVDQYYKIFNISFICHIIDFIIASLHVCLYNFLRYMFLGFFVAILIHMQSFFILFRN